MARPKKEIDEDLVYELAIKGWTNKEIAAECNCSHDTIEGRFSSAIRSGHEIRNGRLRAKLLEMAMGGNVSAAIWLSKQLLGYREKVEVSDAASVKEAIERGKGFLGRLNGRVTERVEGNGSESAN